METETIFQDHNGFEQVIHSLKRGDRAYRAGWKESCIYLNRGNFAAGTNEWPSKIGGVGSRLFDGGLTGTLPCMPNINMAMEDGSTLTGWVPSQVDMLAEDWTIVVTQKINTIRIDDEGVKMEGLPHIDVTEKSDDPGF